MKSNIFLPILILTLTFSGVSAASWVHLDYDWEGDGNDTSTIGVDPPQKWEGCFACHENGIWPGKTRICEDCHLEGGLGPFNSTGTGEHFQYRLREDYNARKVYQHYFGAPVGVPSQRISGAAVTSSTCFGYNNNTGEGRCHGISSAHPIDGYYSFDTSKTLNQSDPYTFTVKEHLPDTNNCLYCHRQENETIRIAWGNASFLGDHYNSTDNTDCYSCHVERGVKPISFHRVIVKLAEGQSEETSLPIIGGGGSPATVESDPFKSGVSILTTELLRQIIIEKNLRYADTFDGPKTLVGPLILLGMYPNPEDPGALRAMAKTSEKIREDVYNISAYRVLQKFDSTDSLILARGDLEVDSMAAIAYAKSAGIPILLTRPTDLPRSTLSAISKLNPKKIIIVGGPVAVSKEVETALASIAKVERIQGKNRVETSIEIAKRSSSSIIVITSAAFPSTDAAFISYIYGAPIIYVDPTGPSNAVKEYFSSLRGVKVVLVGVDTELLKEL